MTSRWTSFYLFVDGYNIINSWPELIEQMKISLESARNELIDYMAEYSKLAGCNLILVFDAHQAEGASEIIENTKGIKVVYTKEWQTADQYIERELGKFGRRDRIKVASSDSMIQKIILGRGGTRISARELLIDFQRKKDDTARQTKAMKRHKKDNIVNIEGKNLSLLEDLLEEYKNNND